MNLKKMGFTLIELLIVIGILGVLAVAVIAAINPGEAQRKGRDIKRMQDLKTLQAVIDQYINDGGAPVCTAVCNSSAGTTLCSANWTGIYLCDYANTIPVDPNNNQVRGVVNDTDADCSTVEAKSNIAALYRLRMDAGGAYEIDVVQESQTNCRNILNDGGNSGRRVEVGTDPILDLLGT
ncbi:type II secretion system protein [Candidatus Roizmanbacteria bacterium]|nr:type II secretion system protein [Candidatus Roizmanbacteria bacterium]